MFLLISNHDKENLTKIGQKQKKCIKPKTYLGSR